MIPVTEISRTLQRAASVFLIAVLTAAWMSCAAESASAAVDLTRQNASSDTATIRMGKTLNSVQANKFPSVTDFSYTLERIQAWDNSNADAGTNGTVISKTDIPLPQPAVAANHTISVSGNTAAVAIGNFMAADPQDTAAEKNRYTDVPIRFTKAGYYVYKVKEAGSTPASIPGVQYDSHEYFIIVYVANKMDSNGDTINGVYVHSITAYRNESGSESYKPDLSDIGKTTDNRGAQAQQNNESNLGKVGISSPSSPDLLRADNMWNKYNTSDLLISNNVQGTLGDRNKNFEFNVSLAGLENNKKYKLSGDVSLDSIATGTYSAQDTSFTTNSEGEAVFKVKLKDDEELKLEALNATSTYTISETANNHIPSYSITAAGGSGASISRSSDANTSDNAALSTMQETVDIADKDQTVAFRNKRDLATLTGTRTSMLAPSVLALTILALAVLFAAVRRISNAAA